MLINEQRSTQFRHFVPLSTQVNIPDPFVGEANMTSGSAGHHTTITKFIVPNDHVTFFAVASLVEGCKEFSDSLVQSIKHVFEPAHYLEVYLFLPQQPPPYFIRFHLPTTQPSEHGAESTGNSGAYLGSCNVSFTAHSTRTSPSTDRTNELKFKVQPSILFLYHTLGLVSQEMSLGDTAISSDMFCRIVMDLFRMIEPAGEWLEDTNIVSKQVYNRLARELTSESE